MNTLSPGGMHTMCDRANAEHFSHHGQKQLEQLEYLRSEIPPAAPWLPILVIHIRSGVKTRQIQSYKFEKIAKSSNFVILPDTVHETHLLMLVDKMYKYEMDPTRTVGATERTRDVGRMDGVKPIYPPQQLRCCPACRTTLVATRFRVAVICPIIQVPHCIRVFFHFVWFVFINHIFQFYYELCTYCDILVIYLS